MDFKSYLESSANQVDQILDQILSEFLNEVKKEKPKLIPFALGLINSCKGGKRIRGVLVKLGYEIAALHLGGVLANRSATIRGDILKIGAALEILHTGILIHDDIVDQSPLRRGQSSLYKALGGNHYGISQAITIGDIGLYLPIKIISEANFADDLKMKAIRHLSQTIIDTGWGQILDVWLTQSDHTSEESKPTSEVVEFVNLFKTAKYTIAGPLKLGAVLAGANEKLLGNLGEFGESLGIAFQIRDDILDGEVESEKIAQSEAREYAKKAEKIIPQMTEDDKMRKLLEEMTEFMVERNK